MLCSRRSAVAAGDAGRNGPAHSRPCAAASGMSLHRIVVGLGGEQADEADLAAGACRRGRSGAPRRSPCRRGGGRGDLRFDLPTISGVSLLELLAQLRRQHRRLAGAAQHRRGPGRAARPGSLGLDRPAPRPRSRRPGARVVVDARAQEDEVLVAHPAQEGLVLLQLVGRQVPGAGVQLADRALGHAPAWRRGRRPPAARRPAWRGGRSISAARLVLRQGIEQDLDHRFRRAGGACPRRRRRRAPPRSRHGTWRGSGPRPFGDLAP